MDTQPKTYGQIAYEAFYGGKQERMDSFASPKWLAAAQAVISAFKEREMEEGWRYYTSLTADEDGTTKLPGDQASRFHVADWKPVEMNQKIHEVLLYRRRACFLKDSHYQDSRQRESEIGGQGDARHSMPPTGSPDGGTTSEGGDTFLDDVMNAIPASQKSQPADGDTFRAGMDRAIEMIHIRRDALNKESSHWMYYTMLLDDLKRERDEHKPTALPTGPLLDVHAICDERDRLKEELAYQQERYTGLCQVEAAIRKDLTACRKELALANERVDAKQQAYERCADQLAEAKRQLTEVTDQMGDATMQRDIMSHLFGGGEITDDLKADAIKCGLGESVFIDQKHEVARLEKELWKVNMECAKAYGERNDAQRQLTESTRWIPVSERMPTKEEFPVVKTYMDGDYRHVGHGTSIDKEFGQIWTHWMPIPPFPMPQEDDGFEEWMNKTRYNVSPSDFQLALKECWNAALASRKEESQS